MPAPGLSALISLLPPYRLLAIDLGDKRTGLAVADTLLRIASPVGRLEVPVVQQEGAALLSALGRAIGEHGARVLVFGLPLNMDGTEGPRAKMVRGFAARLGALHPACEVVFFDERLSSAQADWTMSQAGREMGHKLTHGQKKARRDSIAAAAILQGYVNGLAAG